MEIADCQDRIHTALYAMTAGLHNGVGIYRQHDEAPQVCGLLSLAEEHH